MARQSTLRIIDARAGGDVSRVIVDGAPALRGATVKEQCADFARRFDHLRLKLIQPPHGALHMCPVLLLPPTRPDTDFGVIIMESMGYPPISGSNLFCAAAVALETGLTPMREPETRLRVETPAGVVPVTAECRDGRCRRVAFENTPARIKTSLNALIDAAAAPVPVALISAGVDYVVADAQRLGIRLTLAAGDALVRAGTQLVTLAETDFALFHEPIHAAGQGIGSTVAVFQNPGVICRSPTGTGTSAMLVLAYIRGLIGPQTPFTATSPGGDAFIGRILSVQSGPHGDLLRTVIAGDVDIGPTLTIS